MSWESAAAVVIDVRHVWRRLRRRPLYAGAIVGLLGLAMGGGLAVFGLVDTLILRPLDVPRADEIVTFQRAFLEQGVPARAVAMTWSQAARVQRIPALKDAAVSTTADDALGQHVVVTLPDRGLDDVSVRFVSWNYLHVLGIRPDLGRDLQPGDDGSDSPAVAVLTRAYWLSRFGGRADIVGRVMHVNGVTTTVVGVLDRAFAGTQLGVTAPTMFLPLHAAATIGRNSSAATGPRLRTAAADGGLEPDPPGRPRDFRWSPVCQPVGAACRPRRSRACVPTSGRSCR